MGARGIHEKKEHLFREIQKVFEIVEQLKKSNKYVLLANKRPPALQHCSTQFNMPFSVHRFEGNTAEVWWMCSELSVCVALCQGECVSHG